MTERALNPMEDDALLCVDRMRPAFQKIINQGFKSETLLCAMTTTFAELIRERGGSDEPLNRASVAFAALPGAIRGQVPDCHAKIKAAIAMAKEEGFTLDAILWSMLGAIINLYRAFGFPKSHIDTATETMIMRMNEARQLSVN